MGWKFWTGTALCILGGVVTIGLVATGLGAPIAVATGHWTMQGAVAALASLAVTDAVALTNGVDLLNDS